MFLGIALLNQITITDFFLTLGTGVHGVVDNILLIPLNPLFESVTNINVDVLFLM